MNLAVLDQKTFFCISFSLLILVSLLLLIGPRIPQSQQKHLCVVNVPITGPFGLSLNCDSPEFIKDAVHPSNLLKKNSVRQSRPGLVLAAFVLSKPLFFLNKLANWYHPEITRKDIQPTRVQTLWQSGFAVFAAFLLINFALLMMACYFYFLLVRIKTGVSLATLSLIAIFFSNSLTETYFWSPHTQMFNIMGPLFLCWIFYQGLQRSVFEKRWYGITFAMSLLMTAYGTFLLYAPCLFLIYVYQFFKMNVGQKNFWDYLSRLLIHAIIFSIPTWAWYLLVKHVTGTYYVHEAVVYRQFIWMATAYQQGISPLVYQLLFNTKKTFELIWQQNYLLIWAIAALLCLLKKLKCSLKDKNKIIASAVIAVLSALFVIFDGFVIPRMVSTVIPMMVVVCGYCLECLSTQLARRQQVLLNSICVVSMLGYTAAVLWY